MRNRWVAEEAGSTPLDQLVYMSRLMGQDEALVLWGGGNTSTKVEGTDLLGRPTPLMLIKGSGSDMKAVQPRDFPAVRLEEIRASFDRDEMTDDEMVAYFGQCMMDPSAPRPSIETLLHGFLEVSAVAHSHADAILSLTNTRAGEETVGEAFGSEVVIVPYRRPGFQLAKEVAVAVREHPQSLGVVLMNHGLITWGDTAEEAYQRHIDLVSRAEAFIQERRGDRAVLGPADYPALPEASRRHVAAQLAPVLRRMVSQRGHKVLRFDDSSDVLEFISASRASELATVGAATPDHILNTKRMAAVVSVPDPSNASELIMMAERELLRYDEEYRAYFERYQSGEPLLDSAARVILVPGIGMWTTGRHARACVVPADIYRHTMQIMAGAESVDRYESLSEHDGFHAEYWPLELYKLTLAPRERELAGRIALVTGAAGGIGAAIARRLAAEGAHVVITDVDEGGAERVAQEIVSAQGPGRAVHCRLDVADEGSVSQAFEAAQLAFGGLDVLVSNAGIAHVSPLDQLSLADWERSLAVNATGHFLVAREALRLFKRQRMGGTMVFVATKNVTAPGKDFGAYSAAKAAEAQLARVLAIEGAEHGVRVNMVNPDAIFAGSGLWSDEVRQQRAASHGVPVEQLEELYRSRNL